MITLYVMCYYMMHYYIKYFDVEIVLSGTVNAQLKTEIFCFYHNHQYPNPFSEHPFSTHV